MNRYLSLTFIILFISCASDSNNDIYKTKSGEFASISGNFIANFPNKPNLSVIDNKIGLDEFQINVFRSNLGANKIFSIEYIDYPEYMLKTATDEQLFTQGITNLANKMDKSFKLEFQEPIEQHGLKGKYFVLELKQSEIDRGIKGYFEGKMFRNENRVYTISFFGHSDKNVDSFMNSFRLIK